MRTKYRIPKATFKALFNEFIPWSLICSIFLKCGVRRRRPPRISQTELIQSLIFHVVAEDGTLAAHVKELTGRSITDGALSQRRAPVPMAVFDRLMAAALKPKADPLVHADAFYRGLRLTGLDGSWFSVYNTPQIKGQMSKARSRRGKAAFPKVGVAVMVELGLHNPLAAALGAQGESEMVLAKRVLWAQPQKSLMINDRY